MSRSTTNWFFVVAMIIAGAFLSHPSDLLGQSRYDKIIDLTGLLVSFVGLALRVVSRHWKIEHGNGKLVTSGPYSVIRHPLYVGSFLAGLGLCLILGNVWFLVVFSAAYIALHSRVARGEEKILIEVWPDEYSAYMKSVPGWIPIASSVASVIKPCTRCFTPAAIHRERTAVCGILATTSLLEAWADYAMKGWIGTRVDVVACIFFAVFLFLVMAALQRTLIPRFELH